MKIGEMYISRKYLSEVRAKEDLSCLRDVECERRLGEFSGRHSQKHSAAWLDKSETATAEHDKDSSEPCESPVSGRCAEARTPNG